MTETIYKFGKGISVDKVANPEELGGKGAKLAEMCMMGLPVPPGVIITTQQCMNYLNATSTMTQNAIIENLVDIIIHNYKQDKQDIGQITLVSVRSGARVSMPGMMDTILNVGINDSNLENWAQRLGSMEAAVDCYTRLIKMYGEVVIGIPTAAFDDPCLDAVHNVYTELTGVRFPQTIEEQLAGAIKAVFKSWFSDRAVAYRQIHGYPDDWGTAVTVQQMVFGNRNDKSASGVAFTRDFNTGKTNFIIDWLPKAQGEDVVAGTHTPSDIHDFYQWSPVLTDKLCELGIQLETRYNDMQDIEFTIDHAICNLLFLKHYLTYYPEGDDRPPEGMFTAADIDKLFDAEEYCKRNEVGPVHPLRSCHDGRHAKVQAPELGEGDGLVQLF